MSNFDEQQFIMSNFDAFVHQVKATKYKRFIPLVGENPVLVDHLLRRPKDLSPFMNITSLDYSRIRPRVKIYKVLYNPDGTEREQIRIPFPSTFTKNEVKQILASKAGRGVGTGILGFDWTYDGKDPAQSKTFIKSNLKLFLSSIEELDKSRGKGVTYLDLITRNNRFSKSFKDLEPDEKREISDDYFEIKIVVHYSAPDSIDSQLQECLRTSATTLYLQLLKHDLDFKENGSVELNIEYLGRTSTVLAEENVLEEGKHDKIFKETMMDGAGKEFRIFYKEAEETETMLEIADFDNFVLKAHVTAGTEQVFDVNPESFPALYKNGVVQNSNGFPIKYFTFGDLLDAALKDTSLAEYRILLGSVVLEKYSSYYSVNIADIPISFNTFKKWHKEHIAGDGTKELSVLSFLEKAFNYLVKDAISRASPKSIIPKLKYTSFTVPYDGTTDPLFNRASRDGVLEPAGREVLSPQAIKKIKNSRQAEKTSKSIHYLYLGATQKVFNPAVIASKTTKKENEKLGIYHFAVGRQIGPIISIKFKKQDLPFQKEASIEKGGALMSQYLKTYYNADIELIGAPLFSPGTMVYIDSKRMKAGDPNNRNSLANKLGIGGYYMVLKASSNITGGSYTTSLDCVNLAFQGDETISNITYLDGSEETE